MKISKREKILLIVLSAVIVLGAYYKYIFLHQRETLNKLLEEKNQCGEKLNNIKRQSSIIKQKEFDIKVLNSKIQSETFDLFPKLEEEKLIVELDKIITLSKVNANSLSFSDIEVKPINEDKKDEDSKDEKKVVKNQLKDLADEYNGIKSSKKEETGDKTDEKDKEQANLENMSVIINLKGSYNDVLDFIKNIESYSRKIVIDDLKLSQDTEGGVSGSCTLQFYAVPKLGEEDRNFLKWELNNSYGKDNPFDGAAITLSTGTIEETGKAKELDFDFLMAVRSINSDLPTVMLGKSKDSSKSTYVYADNSRVENIEIYFTKKDGKYYYKYRTNKDTYPVEYSGDGREFTVGNPTINFKIFSNRRLDNTDLSGANLKVYNKTDKEVTVFIEDDDNVRPRISISSEGSNVNVKRN